MSFSVSYIYQVIDKYTPNLSKINASTVKFTNQAHKAALATKKITSSMMTMETAALSAAGAAAVMFPTKAAISFEAAMADVKKVVDFETPAQYEQMRKQIMATGKELGKMPEDIAAIVAAGGRLGIPTDQLGQFTMIAARTATAFDILEGEAGDSLASIKNKLKLNIDETANFMDAVNFLADNTAAKGGDMLNVISRISGNMATIEMPKNLIAGWSSFANQIETTPQLAASGMNMLIERMLKMEGAAEAFKIDPQGTLRTFLDGIKEMPAGDILSEKLGLGVGAGGFALKAINNLELLDDTMSKVSGSTEFMGSMQRELANKLNTSEVRLARMNVGFYNMKIAIGDAVLPVIEYLTPKIIKMTDAIGGFASKHPMLTKFFLAAAAGAALIMPAVVAIGMLSGSVSAVLSLFVVGASVVSKFTIY